MYKDSKKFTISLYIIILVLAVSIIFSLQWYAGSSLEGKVIEAGLIESGDRPALYFNLRNAGEEYTNYTYIVTYNSTSGELRKDGSNITVAPGETFRYSISLIRPSYGIMVIELEIFRDGDYTGTNTDTGTGTDTGTDKALLLNQTWTITS